MKTIRLGSDIESFRIKDGILQVFICIMEKFPQYEDRNWYPGKGDEWKWVDYDFQLGSEVILCSTTNVSPNSLRDGSAKPKYYITSDNGGIPGNSNSNIKRYHGWRGTTNDISVDAHGLRRIVKMKTLKNRQISITLSDDIAPELD